MAERSAPPGAEGLPGNSGGVGEPESSAIAWEQGETRTDPAADTLVVGGGVVGCATAHFLARNGVDVLVVERAALNREASGANAGTIHIQIPAQHFRAQYHDLNSMPPARARSFRDTNRIYAEAARVWSTLEQDLQADLGVRIGGGLMVAETPDELEDLRAKADYENQAGLATRVLSTPEALAVAPGLSPRLAGASYCAAEGFANPLLVSHAFARRAKALGARIRTRTRVTGITLERRDRFLVETTTGPIVARRVVVAAGAQTGEVVALVGLDLPVRPHPLQVIVSEPWPPILTALIQHATRPLSLRQTQYGTFVIGGGWPGVDGAGARVGVTLASIAANAAVAVDVLPPLREVRLLRAWGGMTTATGPANRVGIMGGWERLPGFYVVVTGGWGFTLSPVLGRLMAELIVDGRASLPIDAFDLDHASAWR